MDTTKNIMLRPTLETFAAQAQVFASAWALMGGPFDSGDGLELAEVERGILLDMARRMQEENEALRAQAQTCGAGAGCCAQAARIAELEAQLESLGVGGAAPDGWQLVPAEPTKEMVIEAYEAQGEATSSACEEIYQAMLAAAPQPTAQEQPVATIYVTEDGSREVDDWKVELPVGATTLYTAAQAQKGESGWLRSEALLYRLTDDRRQENFDEIQVTMANGSRDIHQRSAQAERLQVMLTAPQPTAQAGWCDGCSPANSTGGLVRRL